MELSKKTTILFPPAFYDHLARVAKSRKTSVGELIRSACKKLYGYASREERIRAAEELGKMSLPVGTPEQMKRESLPSAEDLLP